MHGSISYLHWDAVFIPFLIILAFLGDRDDDTSHTPLKQEVFTDQTLMLPKPFRRDKADICVHEVYNCSSDCRATRVRHWERFRSWAEIFDFIAAAYCVTLISRVADVGTTMVEIPARC